MLQLIYVFLSFNVVKALIPVLIIGALIAAAAGLSRNTNIFALFGVGTVLGSTARRGTGGGRSVGAGITKTRSGAIIPKGGPTKALYALGIAGIASNYKVARGAHIYNKYIKGQQPSGNVLNVAAAYSTGIRKLEERKSQIEMNISEYEGMRGRLLKHADRAKSDMEKAESVGHTASAIGYRQTRRTMIKHAGDMQSSIESAEKERRDIDEKLKRTGRLMNMAVASEASIRKLEGRRSQIEMNISEYEGRRGRLLKHADRAKSDMEKAESVGHTAYASRYRQIRRTMIKHAGDMQSSIGSAEKGIREVDEQLFGKGKKVGEIRSYLKNAAKSGIANKEYMYNMYRGYQGRGVRTDKEQNDWRVKWIKTGKMDKEQPNNAYLKSLASDNFAMNRTLMTRRLQGMLKRKG